MVWETYISDQHDHTKSVRPSGRVKDKRALNLELQQTTHTRNRYMFSQSYCDDRSALHARESAHCLNLLEFHDIFVRFGLVNR